MTDTMRSAWSATEKSYNGRRRRPRWSLPRHRRFITALGNSGDDNREGSSDLGGIPLTFAGPLAAAQDRFPPSPPRRRWHLEWLAALALHAAVIALAMVSFRPRLSMEAQNQTPISIMVENSGASQTAAPPSPRRGPPVAAQAPKSSSPPPPPPPPPAPQVAPQAPEMNLQIPPDLFAQLQLPQQELQPRQAKPQPAPPRPHPAPHHHPQHPAPHPHYQVMTGMSLGNQASPNAQPPMPRGFSGLNLQLSQSDLNAMQRPELSVQGQIGSDWMDGFNKWVNQRIYYPQAALEQNQQGTSVIQFTVHRDGSITGLRLLSSAGSPFLDQAWLGIFKHTKVPPFPPGTKSDTIKITASLQYEILH